MGEEKIFIGYHGTDAKSADKILSTRTFLPSGSWRDWLGRGIYFFEFDSHQAYMITKARKKIPSKQIKVLECKIIPKHIIDLLTDEDRAFVEQYTKLLNKRIHQLEKIIGKGKWNHKEGYVLDELNKWTPFDMVRAVYRIPNRKTPPLLDYETVQIQICVKNSACIQKDSIKEVDSHVK